MIYTANDWSIDDIRVWHWEYGYSSTWFLRILCDSIHNQRHIAENIRVWTSDVQGALSGAICSMSLNCKKTKHLSSQAYIARKMLDLRYHQHSSKEWLRLYIILKIYLLPHGPHQVLWNKWRCLITLLPRFCVMFHPSSSGTLSSIQIVIPVCYNCCCYEVNYILWFLRCIKVYMMVLVLVRGPYIHNIMSILLWC